MGMRKSVRGGEYDTVDDLPTEGIAYAMQHRALQTKMEVHGVRHPDTMTMMADLVQKWYDQGRLVEVEPVAIQILELRREVLGNDNLWTLVAMRDLAVT